jgi:hypothetical protein
MDAVLQTVAALFPNHEPFGIFQNLGESIYCARLQIAVFLCLIYENYDVRFTKFSEALTRDGSLDN